MRIYIVQGMTGEYSDQSAWIVCAYRSKELAEEHAHNAMRRAREMKKSNTYPYMNKDERNEFDPDMEMDYTGTEYTVLETELHNGKGAN